MEHEKVQATRSDAQLIFDAFRAAPIGIALEDLEGRPVFVNPALCEMLGFSEGELRNKHCVEFSPPEDAEKDWALFQQLRAGSIDHYHLDKRYLRRDGSLIWGRLSISLLNGTPPLVVAMVEDITAKKATEEALLSRLEFEGLLSELSRTFINLPENEVDANIENGLARVGVFLKMDRITLYEFSPDRTTMAATYTWNAPGVRKTSRLVTTDALPWWRDRILGGEPTLLSQLDDLPEEAFLEKEFLCERGVVSAAAIPLQAGGEINGVMIFVTVEHQVSWTEDLTNQLKIIGDLFWNGLKRKRGMEALLDAEAIARDNEERFHLAMNNIASGVYTLDLNGLVTYINPAAEKMFGWTNAELLGKNKHDITHYKHPDGTPFPSSDCPIYQVLKNGIELREHEDMFIRKDGSFVPVVCSASPLKKGGEIIGVVIGIRDDTQRRAAEQAVRESEQRLRLATQAGRMYAFDWDVASDMIVRSGDSMHVLGLAGESARLTKRELLSRVHPEDREKFTNSLAECIPERPNTQISYRLLRPDGSVVWLERTGHALFDHQGKMVRMIGMVANVTERKLTEERFKEYERAVEGAGEMIVVVDRDYRYLIANNMFLQMRNLTREQVLGHFAWEVLNKGLFEAVIKPKLDECFKGKVVRYETKFIYPELGERDIFGSYFPIEGATGVDRVACILQDITERKRAEEALSAVSQKLIEAQEEERTRIARELHDDINQRLALLRVQFDSLKPGEVRKQIEDLAGDIQALSHRLHSPKLEYLGLSAAAAGLCRELSDRQAVEIDFDAENVPKELSRGTSLALFRVLQEALQNAIKHSGKRQFRVSLKGGTDQIELTVRDFGVGFDPDEAIRGRGLGLTSMNERLKLVNGNLSIESQLQRGTTIHARVPFHRTTKSAGAVG